VTATLAMAVAAMTAGASLIFLARRRLH
jgi:hypothetical protein